MTAETLTAELHAFLATWDPPRFERGRFDCCGMAAAWVERVTGRPVVSPWLGRPLTDREAAGLVIRAGGLRAMVGQVLEGHGWALRPAGEAPEDGDVIVADFARGFRGALVGVWSAGRVVSVGPGGGLVVIGPAEIEGKGAWRGC